MRTVPTCACGNHRSYTLINISGQGCQNFWLYAITWSLQDTSIILQCSQTWSASLLQVCSCPHSKEVVYNSQMDNCQSNLFVSLPCKSPLLEEVRVSERVEINCIAFLIWRVSLHVTLGWEGGWASKPWVSIWRPVKPTGWCLMTWKWDSTVFVLAIGYLLS